MKKSHLALVVVVAIGLIGWSRSVGAAYSTSHDQTSLTLSAYECSAGVCNHPVTGLDIFVGIGSDQISVTTDANGWARADLSGIGTDFIPFSPQLRGDVERQIECWTNAGSLPVDIAGWDSATVYYIVYPPEGENVSCDVLMQGSANTPGEDPGDNGVVKLPNTGIGSAKPAAIGTLSAFLLLTGLFGVLGAITCNRRSANHC